MAISVTYNCLEFNGELLYPSFSIYLFEIFEGRNKYYYVGMTGDRHYPSARSILHRLAGHIDLTKRSRQSQLLQGINKLFGKKGEHLTLTELKTLKIKLHHWPIEGFERWDGNMKDFDTDDPKYKSYDAKRKRVSNLENIIIHDFSDYGLLNKASRKAIHDLNEHEQKIYNAIKDIINK